MEKHLKFIQAQHEHWFPQSCGPSCSTAVLHQGRTSHDLCPTLAATIHEQCLQKQLLAQETSASEPSCATSCFNYFIFPTIKIQGKANVTD